MELMPPSLSMSCPFSIGRFSAVPHWPLLGVPRRDVQDRATLCIFAAAMNARSDSQSAIFETFASQIAEMVNLAEQNDERRVQRSAEIEAYNVNLRPHLVSHSLDWLAKYYFSMNLAVLIAPATDPFITSDTPSVWCNPEKYSLAPDNRGASLAQKDIEITMPMTPAYSLLLSHQSIVGYKHLTGKQAQEFNRRSRFTADKYFVSWKGEVRKEWFDPGTPPADRRENSPKAKRAEERTRALAALFENGNIPKTIPISLLDTRRNGEE